MSYVSVIKTGQLKVDNLHHGGLFFPYEALVCRNGENHTFSIEVKDINGVPDCRIGNFYLNVWFRPKKALDSNFEGYKSVPDFSRAVINCLNRHGYRFLGWVERT